MDLLVAHQDDPAGHNMAKYVSTNMQKDGDIYHGKNFDLVIIPTPAISADWLEEKYDYDGFVFLSRHAAESGVLALTCHSTGNFSEAKFGGNEKQIAVPYPNFQKAYFQSLYKKRNDFAEFQITLEATHHGPTALNKPSIFVEIGTTEKQWNDTLLCNSVAQIVVDVLNNDYKKDNPIALCIGGTHYPDKFTNEVINGECALGTIIPKHALEFLDEKLFSHILQRNHMASKVLLEWSGLGKHKQKVLDLIEQTDLEVIKL